MLRAHPRSRVDHQVLDLAEADARPRLVPHLLDALHGLARDPELRVAAHLVVLPRRVTLIEGRNMDAKSAFHTGLKSVLRSS